MKALAATALGALALAGCSTTPAPSGRVPPPKLDYNIAGLEPVMGQDAAGLERLFGTPDADVTEGGARKLQFLSEICVLDAYLYAPATGRGARTVTYVDARQRDGSPIDRASCVAALKRRGGGK